MEGAALVGTAAWRASELGPADSDKFKSWHDSAGNAGTKEVCICVREPVFRGISRMGYGACVGYGICRASVFNLQWMFVQLRRHLSRVSMDCLRCV